MNGFILIVIIAVPLLTVAGLYFFFGFKGHGGQLRSTDWALDAWSKNVALDNPPAGGSIFSFKFPNKDGVHTISKRIKGLTVGGQVSMTFDIAGKDPVFEAAGETPTVGFWVGAGAIYSRDPNYRLALRLGRQTLTVPLTPECWKTINGFPCDYDQAHINEFERAVKQATTIGPCFGDTHGLAHGANLTTNGGSANFRMIVFVP